MKVTLFTSNKRRHNYFINFLSNLCDDLFVIQENSTIYPGIMKGSYKISNIASEYFKKVTKAEVDLFGDQFIHSSKKNLKILPLAVGDLNKTNLNFLKNFLKSDLYIIFGSSYIKGELIEFLVHHKAINIHMGISPYYRGTDCNFWALYDDNPHLVGATIHRITKGLDSGPILYHAISNFKQNPFNYSMSTVKSAFHSIAEKVKDESILKIRPLAQDSSKEIRYSKKIDFNDKIIMNFNKKKLT